MKELKQSAHSFKNIMLSTKTALFDGQSGFGTTGVPTSPVLPTNF